jgi:hypothetical protein
MFARTVPLVLITALIACPMWCGNGVCHADQCCSEQQSSHQACPVHETASCCCDKGSTDSNDDCPSDAPCSSSCQGVCGGAVFEKPIELNDGMDSSFLPLLAVEMSVASQMANCHDHYGDYLLHCGGNHGRSLRTRHMSFLC